MASDKTARVEWVQVVPVRMSIDVFSVQPRRPVLSEEPLVEVKGVIDFNPHTGGKDLPMWFKAGVQIYEDRTSEIVTFEPYHASIHGSQVENLLAIYEHAFSRALVDTNLKILKVVA
jgi:hypothetical protein